MRRPELRDKATPYWLWLASAFLASYIDSPHTMTTGASSPLLLHMVDTSTLFSRSLPPRAAVSFDHAKLYFRLPSSSCRICSSFTTLRSGSFFSMCCATIMTSCSLSA